MRFYASPSVEGQVRAQMGAEADYWYGSAELTGPTPRHPAITSPSPATFRGRGQLKGDGPMASDTAAEIVKSVGGAANIESLTPLRDPAAGSSCATHRAFSSRSSRPYPA